MATDTASRAASRTLPDPEQEPTLRVARCAEILDCGLRSAYDAIERGDWPAIRVGRAIRIPTARWLRAVGLADGEAA
ncbi:MAG: hypothetical protein ACRDT2_02490 [Natronosporangium sp.]